MDLSAHAIKDATKGEIDRPLNILIVEDVPEDVELITLTLESNGIAFCFDTVACAADARYHLSTYLYDVVLSDYGLAQFNGLQAFDILVETGQDIPFILVTGSLGEEAAVECIKAGMTDYVLKDRLFRLPTVLERALKEFELRRQQHSAITLIQRQARRDAMVNRIVQAMRETLILETVLQTTVDQLHELLEVNRCSIFQPDPEQKTKATIAYLSKATSHRKTLLRKRSDLYSYYQEALIREKTALLHHLDELPAEHQQEALTSGAHSMLLMPLLYQNAYLGGICLEHRDQSRLWSEDELAILRAIADHCAIAIHQARLYEQAQTELAERQRVEAQLRHHAFHDALTGLPNRALFTDRLEHALQLAKRRSELSSSANRHQFAVLFLDLDRFKVVNDSLGHATGDQLLRKVSEQLQASVRKSDTIARLGGDEFVILLEDLENANEAIEVAERIHQRLKRPMLLGGQEIFISTSIGIALNSELYTSPDQVLRDADIAMYRAKKGGRGSYEIFDSCMHDIALRQLQLENDLQRAIDREELRVYYQPIINLETQKIESFEALVRWQHPEKGMISPADFIPVAEETGIVCEIDFLVLRQAAQQLHLWQQAGAGLSHLQISVNLSGKHFSKGGLIPQIDQILQFTGISGSCLKIEITEGVLIENAEFAAQILEELRNRQIWICLDDFGTGHSSLSYLHRFPINSLKIDQSFVTSMEDDSEKREIVKAIVSLARSLRIDVVAEGVESSSQLSFLQSVHCHGGQGFYFSPALDASDASDFLRRQSLDSQR
jgi:diguanylate cyclase (GGDEF)-like protein